MTNVTAEVKHGDILVIFGDEESQEADRQLGYFLATSFGKVIAIDFTDMSVSVDWLFAESYSSVLRRWLLPDKSIYRGKIVEHEIFTGDSTPARPLKALLDSKRRLSAETKKEIRRAIGDEEFNKHA